MPVFGPVQKHQAANVGITVPQTVVDQAIKVYEQPITCPIERSHHNAGSSRPVEGCIQLEVRKNEGKVE